MINSAGIARQYGLNATLASEIVADETQRALRRSALAWLVLLAGIVAAGATYFVLDGESTPALWILVGSCSGWLLLGRRLATPAIHAAAHAKAQRLAELHG